MAELSGPGRRDPAPVQLSTLWRGGPVRTRTGMATRGWVATAGPTITAVGEGDDHPACDRIVDLDGATLLPAFCDPHVHLGATGIHAAGMDFRGERSAGRIAEAFAAAADKGRLLFGGGFEEPLDGPLGAAELDLATGGRPALLVRADMHSCVVSSAVLQGLALDGVEGVERDRRAAPTGYLREQAAGAAWRWFEGSLTRAQQRAAARAAVDTAYSRGVATVHEMYVVEWRGWSPLEVLMEIIDEVALDVVLYVATDDVDRVNELGLGRIGGDYFLDGSFGSHTAWLSEPYPDPPPPGCPEHGISYRSDDEVAEFFREAQASSLQTGVHVIGDAAVEQAIAAWELLSGEVGIDAVRALGHRLEHFELASDDHIERAARLGLRISVQPAFDAMWGGPGGMYAARIGWERARLMNRFRSMLAAGLRLGAGSDSPVTPLDPAAQMAALRAHHVEEQSLDGASALDLVTSGAHGLAGMSGVSGSITPGLRADLTAVADDGSGGGAVRPEVVGTWAAGTRVWPPEAAEVS